eukprot:566513-Lingulodinium_polyedra.AAC.1
MPEPLHAPARGPPPPGRVFGPQARFSTTSPSGSPRAISSAKARGGSSCAGWAGPGSVAPRAIARPAKA